MPHRSCWAILAALAIGCINRAPPAPSTADWKPSARATAFLDTLQRRTFDFFWERTSRRNGLTPDRWPSKSFSSIAAVGFALTAYPIGVERGYVSRADAGNRVLTTLRFFWEAPQGDAVSGMTGYRGFFYHFLDLETGRRFERVELSTIDTTLLLGGMLFCQVYFDGTDPTEIAIRAYADSVYRRVDWRWAQLRVPLVSMGWHQVEGFNSYDWRGLNEAMLLYVLALGSPTHPLDPAAWDAWTSTYQWGRFYGQDHVGFAPLFGHQYSQAFIDFRGIQDAYMRGRGIDYFENSRRATYSQRAYAVANPGKWTGYAADAWGLTASDGPADTSLVIDGRTRRFMQYAARGASFNEVRDDGTIAPTAAGGSLPFAPEIALPALIAMREQHGDALFGRYGFLDAFNETFPGDRAPGAGRTIPGRGWYDTDYLGIDQGPILIMAENYRTGLVWRYMRRHPAIIRGLRRAGFTGGWLDQAPATQ
ncbi:MAG: hypothetical protein QOH59_2034 [Gemmatimonadales bacterium]|nr:hypothetical protein [Gemmatimonadales bacterium]